MVSWSVHNLEPSHFINRFCRSEAVRWDDIIVYHLGDSAVLISGSTTPEIGVTCATDRFETSRPAKSSNGLNKDFFIHEVFLMDN